jgi:hypothetical protein
MAYMLSWSGTKNDIVDRFEDWARGLKDFAEERASVMADATKHAEVIVD